MFSFIWVLVLFAAIAVATPFILKLVFPHKVTLKEILLSVVGSVVVAFLVFFITIHIANSNTEILNGKVTSKYRDEVSCEHSYQVCTGSGDSQVCTTHYEHWEDYDWVVQTTVGKVVINRVDRQGVQQPPRWTVAEVGEPASLENSYTDYLKNVDKSLLYRENHNKRQDFEKLLASYPRVRDYYRANHVLFRGVNVSKDERKEWNDSIANMLKTLGPMKQINVIIVFANTDDASFGEYLRNHWHNGRKNDLIVTIGSTDYPNIDWVYSFGWSKNHKVFSTVNYDLEHLETANVLDVTSLIQNNARKHFERDSMENYEHYFWEANIPTGTIVFATIAYILLNAGLAVWIVKNDIQ